MEHWEKLIWDWPTATRRYDVADWQAAMEGMVQTFNQQYKLNLAPCEPYDIGVETDDWNEPGVEGRLVGFVSTPVCPLIYYGLVSIATYHTEEGRHICPNIFMFLFFGKTRLLAENFDAQSQRHDDDYIGFLLTQSDQPNERWKKTGWEIGYYDEWYDLELPDTAIEYLKTHLPNEYKELFSGEYRASGKKSDQSLSLV